MASSSINVALARLTDAQREKFLAPETLHTTNKPFLLEVLATASNGTGPSPNDMSLPWRHYKNLRVKAVMAQSSTEPYMSLFEYTSAEEDTPIPSWKPTPSPPPPNRPPSPPQPTRSSVLLYQASTAGASLSNRRLYSDRFQPPPKL